MDLERIKQNLRLRSGRFKKPPKRAPVQRPTTVDQNTRTDSNPAHQTNGYGSVPPPVDPSITRSDSEANSHGKGVNGGLNEQELNSKVNTRPSATEEDANIVDSGESNVNEQQEQEQTENTDEPEISGESKSQDSGLQTPSAAMADPYTLDAGDNNDNASESEDYDLRPPAPQPRPPSVESISELLFSPDHLSTLINDPVLIAKFTTFLRKYRPQDYPLLTRYLETSKAIRAIEYANAVAESAASLPEAVAGNETETLKVAASLDTSFQEACSSAFHTLVDTSLPLYITYQLIRTVSDCLIDEITGQASSTMHGMVGGLSEVFCLSDPSQEDNPIVYASEEFYRLTGYRQEDTLGKNCRFLQGSKTNLQSTKRLGECIGRGEETYETLLNYRRDGKPFVNMLLIAPLHDDRGTVKYHLGAQVDVSPLIGSGRVLEGFQKFLLKREADRKREAEHSPGSADSGKAKKKKVLDKLRGLSELFDLEESAIVRSSSRSSSLERDSDARSIGNGSARRRFVDSEASEDDEDEDEDGSVGGKEAWKLGQEGPLGMSGKLPGVYEKYMLIRPAPSLRIVFVSPKLRKFGSIVQSPFLSHVAAPGGTLSGLAESFKSGIPVTAKINFMPQRSENRFGVKISPHSRHEDGQYGRACWMSATPLLGGDDRIGVWMIVFVEKAQAKAQRARWRRSQETVPPSAKQTTQTQTKQQESQSSKQRVPGPPGTNQEPVGKEDKYSLPIKPKRLEEPIHITTPREENKHSASAYQYQAAPPVEEYRSAGDDSSASSLSPTPRADMPPRTPENENVSDEEYVHPVGRSSPSPSPHRVRIRPDNDSEHASLGDDFSNNRLDLTQDSDEENFRNPNSITPSIPSDRESLPDNEGEAELGKSTPAERLSPERDQERGRVSAETIRKSEYAESTTPQNKSPPASPKRSGSPEAETTPQTARNDKTQASRTSSALPAALSYVDYFRHSGTSRPSSRKLNQSGQISGQGNEGFGMNDACISPYSVD